MNNKIGRTLINMEEHIRLYNFGQTVEMHNSSDVFPLSNLKPLLNGNLLRDHIKEVIEQLDD